MLLLRREFLPLLKDIGYAVAGIVYTGYLVGWFFICFVFVIVVLFLFGRVCFYVCFCYCCFVFVCLFICFWWLYIDLVARLTTVFKCNGVQWSKDKTQAAESIKWRPQQAYGSNQFLLVQPQTVFSTHTKSVSK